MNYLLDRFEKEQTELGQTMWAGYNALTHWATHTDETIEREVYDPETKQMKLQKIRSGKSTADVPSVQRTSNDEVRDVIECDAWKELRSSLMKILFQQLLQSGVILFYLIILCNIFILKEGKI